MRKEFILRKGDTTLPVSLVAEPTDEEKQSLIKEFEIDEHTINSALDSDELPRLELDSAYPNFLAIIFKIPKNHSAADQLLLRTNSVGILMFNEKLLVLSNEETPVLDIDPKKIQSRSDLILKLIVKSIVHFREHMRFISSVSDDLQQQVYKSVSNKHLAELFTLQRSLVYYVTAIALNGTLLSKLKHNATKLGFTPENMDLLDDVIADNDQCYKQAEVTSGILASLMDARASIVNNNLQILMKMLNILTIAIMLPTLIVSIFSMNVNFPFQHHPITFWIILALAGITSATAGRYLLRSKWGQFD